LTAPTTSSGAAASPQTQRSKAPQSPNPPPPPWSSPSLHYSAAKELGVSQRNIYPTPHSRQPLRPYISGPVSDFFVEIVPRPVLGSDLRFIRTQSLQTLRYAPLLENLSNLPTAIGDQRPANRSHCADKIHSLGFCDSSFVVRGAQPYSIIIRFWNIACAASLFFSINSRRGRSKVIEFCIKKSSSRNSTIIVMGRAVVSRFARTLNCASRFAQLPCRNITHLWLRHRIKLAPLAR